MGDRSPMAVQELHDALRGTPRSASLLWSGSFDKGLLSPGTRSDLGPGAESNRRETRVEGQQCQQPNAWFVTLAASGTQVSGLRSHPSPIREFLRVATHPHKFVLWCRQSQCRPHNLHAYKWDHLARRVNLSSPPLCASAPLRDNLQSPSPISYLLTPIS
jgi:hypothetical protein